MLTEHATTVEEVFEGEFTAEVNPNNQQTEYFFEYSTEAENGELVGTITTVGSGTIAGEVFGPQPISTRVREKPANATYYYRVVARNKTGTTYGKVQAYAKVPRVDAESVSGIALHSATLKADIYPNFQQTRYAFEYATSKTALEEGHGTKVIGASELEANEEEVPPIPVSVAVHGLEENTTYYYRLVAENASSENPGNPNKGKPVVGEIAHFKAESLPLADAKRTRRRKGQSAAIHETSDYRR